MIRGVLERLDGRCVVVEKRTGVRCGHGVGEVVQFIEKNLFNQRRRGIRRSCEHFLCHVVVSGPSLMGLDGD